jgi:hypothetical protein
MQKVQDRFAVQVPELPDTIDTATYSKSPSPSSLSVVHTLLLFPRFSRISTHHFCLFNISLFSVMYGRRVIWKTRRMQDGSLL